MSAVSTITANAILNRVAVEVGFDPDSDPYASSEQHFRQMTYLLQTCGEELALAYQWEILNKAYQVTTQDTDSGNYPLPQNFHYMIPQTGWERAENVPLFGPLSAQDWTYLLGRDLVSYTIYASFRIKDGQFSIFPQPPPNGLDINFEYQSQDWVQDGDDPDVQKATVEQGNDVPLYDRTLITRMLKLKWLEAKGFDTTAPQADFNQVFGFLTGKDKAGGEIISAGGRRVGFPYLNGFRNTPDTGYGQ